MFSSSILLRSTIATVSFLLILTSTISSSFESFHHHHHSTSNSISFFCSAADIVEVNFTDLDWKIWPDENSDNRNGNDLILSPSTSNCDSTASYLLVDLDNIIFDNDDPSSSQSSPRKVISINTCDQLKKIVVIGTLQKRTTLEISENKGLDQIIFISDPVVIYENLVNSSLVSPPKEQVRPTAKFFNMSSDSHIIISKNLFTETYDSTPLLTFANTFHVDFEQLKITQGPSSIVVEDNTFEGNGPLTTGIRFIDCYFDHPQFSAIVRHNDYRTVLRIYATSSLVKLQGGAFARGDLLNISGNTGWCGGDTAACYLVFVNMFATQNMRMIDLSHNDYFADRGFHVATVTWQFHHGELKGVAEGLVPPLPRQHKNIPLIRASHNRVEISPDHVMHNNARSVFLSWEYGTVQRFDENVYVDNISRLEINYNRNVNGSAVDHVTAATLELQCRVRRIGLFQAIGNQVSPAVLWQLVFAIYFQSDFHAVYFEKIQFEYNRVEASMSRMARTQRSLYGGGDCAYDVAGVIHFYLQADPLEKNYLLDPVLDVAPMNISVSHNTWDLQCGRFQIIRFIVWNITYPIKTISVNNNSGTKAELFRVDERLQKKDLEGNCNTESSSSLAQLSFQPISPIEHLHVYNNNFSMYVVDNPNAPNSFADGVLAFQLLLNSAQLLQEIVLENNTAWLNPLSRGKGFQEGYVFVDVTMPQSCDICNDRYPGPVDNIIIRNNDFLMKRIQRIGFSGAIGVMFRKAVGAYGQYSNILVENNQMRFLQVDAADNAIAAIGFVTLEGGNISFVDQEVNIPAMNVKLFIAPYDVNRLDMISDVMIRGNDIEMEILNRDWGVSFFLVSGGMISFFGDLVFESNTVNMDVSAPLLMSAESRAEQGLQFPSSALFNFIEIMAVSECEIPENQMPPEAEGFDITATCYMRSTHAVDTRPVQLKNLQVLDGNEFNVRGTLASTISTQVPLSIYEGIKIVNSSFHFQPQLILSHTFIGTAPYSGIWATQEFLFKGVSTYYLIRVDDISLSGIQYSVDATNAISTITSSSSSSSSSNNNLAVPPIDPQQYFGFLHFTRDEFHLSVQEFSLSINNTSSFSFKDSLERSASSSFSPNGNPRQTPSLVKFIQSKTSASRRDSTDRILTRSNITLVNTSVEVRVSRLMSKSPYSASVISNAASTNFGLSITNSTLEMNEVTTAMRVPVAAIAENSNAFTSTTIDGTLKEIMLAELLKRNRFYLNLSTFSSVKKNSSSRSNSVVTYYPTDQEVEQIVLKNKVDKLQSLMRNPFVTEFYIDEYHITTSISTNIYNSIFQIPSSSSSSLSSTTMIPLLWAKCIFWNGKRLSSSSNFGFPLLDVKPYPSDFVEPNLDLQKCRPLASLTKSLSFSESIVPLCVSGFSFSNLAEFSSRVKSVRQLKYYQKYEFSLGLILPEFDGDGDGANKNDNGNSNKYKLPGHDQSAAFTVFKASTQQGTGSYSRTSVMNNVQIIEGNDAIRINETYSTGLRTLKVVAFVTDTGKLNEEQDFSFTLRVHHNLLACRMELNDGEKLLQKDQPQLFGDSTESGFAIKPYTDVTITFEKTAPGVPQDLVANIGNAGRVASAVTAATGSGMVASTMARSLLLGRYVDCLFDPAEEPLEFELSPLGWSVGRHKGRFLRGAVVGNGTLLAVMFSTLAILVLVYLWRRDVNRKREWKKKHNLEEDDGAANNNKSNSNKLMTALGLGVKNNNKNNTGTGTGTIFPQSHIKSTKNRGPPSMLTWKKFRMSMLSIGATSMLYNLNCILLQGSVSSSVSLFLYGPPESIWMDRMMSIGTILITFGVGIYMVWVTAIELPRRRRIQFFWNLKKQNKNYMVTPEYGMVVLNKSEIGGENDETDSDSPDEAEILKFVLHVPSKKCPQCAAERETKKKRREKIRKERIQRTKSARGLKSMLSSSQQNMDSSFNNSSNNPTLRRHSTTVLRRKSTSLKKKGGEQFELKGQLSMFGNSGRGRIDLLEDDDDDNDQEEELRQQQKNNKNATKTDKDKEGQHRRARRSSSVGARSESSNFSDSHNNINNNSNERATRRRRSSINSNTNNASTSSHPFGPAEASVSSVDNNLMTWTTSNESNENNTNNKKTTAATLRRTISKRKGWYHRFYKEGKNLFSYDGFWRITNHPQFAPSTSSTANDEQQNQQYETSFTNDKKFFLFTNDVFRDTHNSRGAQYYPTFSYCLSFILAMIQGYAPQAESDSCRGFGTSLALLNCLPSLWLLTTFPFRHWLMNFYTSISSFVIVFQSVVLLVGYLESNYELGWLQTTSLILTMSLQMIGVMMMLLDIVMVFFESPYFVVYIVRRLRHMILHQVGGMVRSAEGYLNNNNNTNNLHHSRRHPRTTIVNILGEEEEEQDVDHHNEEELLEFPLLSSRRHNNNRHRRGGGKEDGSSSPTNSTEENSSENTRSSVVRNRGKVSSCWTL